MTKLLQAWCPHLWVARVEDIPCMLLHELGITGLLIDVDNTLVDWHQTEVRTEVAAWIQCIKESGIAICLLSNTVRGERLHKIAETLDVPCVPCGVIPYFGKAKHPVFGAKPHRSAFERGIAKLGHHAEKVAMIGDQLFTDIRGAKRFRLKLAILVTPSSRKEHFGTRLKRRPEAFVLWAYRKVGWLALPKKEL